MRPPALPKTLVEEWRCAVDAPNSARFEPEELRPNIGGAGRPGAMDIRELDTERAWFPVVGACCIFDIELERFKAEAGRGIAEALL